VTGQAQQIMVVLVEHKLINFKRFSLDKALIIVSIAIYFVLGLFLLQNYLYIINSDGISYISIAQHYMQGRF
jgi:low affinity Fe/Cu permease